MAVSHLFLSSILVAAILGISSAENTTYIEGSINCVRNGKWTPLEGAVATIECKAFVEDAVTNKKGYFLRKLQVTETCSVSLQNPGPKCDNCVVPDPKASFDFAKVKYKDGNVTIYTSKTLVYKPLF